MKDPVELLWLISRKTKKLLIWSHYYDEEMPERNMIPSPNLAKEATAHQFQGKTYSYHRQEYGVALTFKTFCGGTLPYSSWMTREGILSALKEFGYGDVTILEDLDSLNGPCILLTAQI
jgi:hypothetical protein